MASASWNAEDRQQRPAYGGQHAGDGHAHNLASARPAVRAGPVERPRTATSARMVGEHAEVARHAASPDCGCAGRHSTSVRRRHPPRHGVEDATASAHSGERRCGGSRSRAAPRSVEEDVAGRGRRARAARGRGRSGRGRRHRGRSRASSTRSARPGSGRAAAARSAQLRRRTPPARRRAHWPVAVVEVGGPLGHGARQPGMQEVRRGPQGRRGRGTASYRRLEAGRRPRRRRPDCRRAPGRAAPAAGTGAPPRRGATASRACDRREPGRRTRRGRATARGRPPRQLVPCPPASGSSDALRRRTGRGRRSGGCVDVEHGLSVGRARRRRRDVGALGS